MRHLYFCLTNDEMKMTMHACQRQLLLMVDSTYQNLRTHQKGNNEYVFVSSVHIPWILRYYDP